MSILPDRIRRAAMELFAEKGVAQISVSELAQAAGVARGTIYSNVEDPGSLFERIASELIDEMHQRVVATRAGAEDPVQRLAIGIRLFVRRAHDEPLWGRFITRFAFTKLNLEHMWLGPPMEDLTRAVATGRYTIRPDQIPTVLAGISGAVVGAMLLVLEGRRTWRDAGSDTAELVLRGLGVPIEVAQAFATAELPPLT